MTPFLSNPADCVDVWGFVPISDEWEITKAPLIDGTNEIFGRLGARAWRERLAELGWELPTVEDYEAMKAIAIHIEPYVLPTAQMTLDAGIALHDQDAIERYRVANMMTLAWCKQHDAECFARAQKAGWDSTQAIDNFGKHWALPSTAHPARPFHSLIFGWWTPFARRYGVSNDVLIQPPSDFHDEAYDDYGTTAHAKRKRS